MKVRREMPLGESTLLPFSSLSLGGDVGLSVDAIVALKEELAGSPATQARLASYDIIAEHLGRAQQHVLQPLRALRPRRVAEDEHGRQQHEARVERRGREDVLPR